MLNAIHEGRSAKILKSIALGFIAMGAFGLLLMDVGGFFQSGGPGASTIARVGNTKINAIEFEREAANILRNQGMSIQDAYRFGTLRTLLNEKIDAELLRQEAQDQRLILDRDTIAKIVHDLIEAQIQPGETAQDALNRILRANGMTEAGLIASINQSTTSSLLQLPLLGAGAYVPNLGTQALARFQAERRDISFFPLTAAQAGRDIKADDETLRAYFETIKDQYQVPEQRSFKVITLDSNDLKKSINITEEDVKNAYDMRRDQYRIGEQRTIEQAVTRDAEQAAQIAQAARAGTELAPQVPASGYRKPADVTRDGLPTEMAEAVFTAEKGTVLNPIQTPLGYHVIRVIDVKPARVQEYSTVRETLRRELESDALHEEMEALITRADEAISAGENIEDIATSLGAKTRIIGPIDRTGNHTDKASDTILSALAANHDVLNNIFALMEGETSDITQITDNLHAMFSLENIQPTRDRDFAEIKSDVEKRWLAEQQSLALNASIDTIMDKITKGEITFEQAANDMGAKLRTVRDVSRESKVIGINDPIALGRIFDETNLDNIIRVTTEDGVILARILDARIPAAGKTEPSNEVAEQWRLQTQMAISNLFYDKLRSKHKIRINENNFNKTFNREQQSF